MPKFMDISGVQMSLLPTQLIRSACIGIMRLLPVGVRDIRMTSDYAMACRWNKSSSYLTKEASSH